MWLVSSGWGGEKSCCELLEVIKILTRVVILQLERGDGVKGRISGPIQVTLGASLRLEVR